MEPSLAKDMLLLNIGSGKQKLPGFINVDIEQKPTINNVNLLFCYS